MNRRIRGGAHLIRKGDEFHGGATTRFPAAGPVKITRPDGTVEWQRALTYRERRDRSPKSSRKHVTHDMKLEVFKRDKGKCRLCGTDKGPFHVDHIRPYSKGGWNVLSNLQLLCAPCNMMKGAKWKAPTTEG